LSVTEFGLQADGSASADVHGRVIRIRPLEAQDHDALIAMNSRSSDRSLYRRFFTANRNAADSYIERLLKLPVSSRQALVAVADGAILGIAAYELSGPCSADVSILIDEHDQHTGIGTLLVRALADVGRSRGIRCLLADVLRENVAMLMMVQKLGFTPYKVSDHGEIHMVFDLQHPTSGLDETDLGI
jgi:GNAT superfamily N-acetyltransferase